MAMRIGGKRRKSRQKMRKDMHTRGKFPIIKFFQEFKEGDSVQLKAEPAYQKGIYHLDFHGKAGIVVGKQGSNYKVEIRDGGKRKCLLVHPVHLQRMQVI